VVSGQLLTFRNKLSKKWLKVGMFNLDFCSNCHSELLCLKEAAKQLLKVRITILDPLQLLRFCFFFLRGRPLKMVDVLKGASGGLALRGVNLARFEDSVALRMPLLTADDMKDDVKLHELMEAKQVTSETFSAEDLELANKAMRSLGFGAQNELKAGIFGSTGQAGYDKFTSGSNASQFSSTFYGLTESYVLRVASYTFDKSDMKLSKSALKSLRTVEMALKSKDEVLARLRGFNFFREYGSHATPGPIYFGGTLRWTATSDNFSSNEFKRIACNTSKSLGKKENLDFVL
jgi:hypothetical protein